MHPSFLLRSSFRPTSAMSFSALPDSVLPDIFAHVTPGKLLKLSLVSKRFATACEQNFRQLCASKGWVAPRMPRGDAAKHHCFPLRAEYRCAKLPAVQSRLVAGSLYVDVISISGTRRLFAKPMPPLRRA